MVTVFQRRDLVAGADDLILGGKPLAISVDS